MRKSPLIFGLLLLAVCGFGGPSASGRGSETQPPQTVDRVDLDRYLGTWYEVAKIPNWFQRGCVRNTTAQYSRLTDGRIQVVNRCVDRDGNTATAQGVARVLDAESGAKLEVSFVSLFGWHLFWGDYWVIGLGSNYEYAVVGSPNRRYGWILSRTPDLSPQARSAIDTLLTDRGYEPAKFQPTEQDPA